MKAFIIGAAGFVGGHLADQIAAMLGMDGQQIRDILVCMQSFPEDDPLAVARLIVLG